MAQSLPCQDPRTIVTPTIIHDASKLCSSIIISAYNIINLLQFDIYYIMILKIIKNIGKYVTYQYIT
jgi:hypothetical protein